MSTEKKKNIYIYIYIYIYIVNKLFNNILNIKMIHKNFKIKFILLI